MEDEAAATATTNAGPTEAAAPGPAEPKGRGKTQPSDHPASDAPKSEPTVASDAQSAASSVESTTKKPASASARMNPRGEAKKPSPRVRKSADDQPKKKADKRKSGKQTAATMAAADNASNNSSGAMEKKEHQEPTDSEAAMQAAANQPRASVTELLPAEDNELRKEYLHRIYHQLRITHQNQNDDVLRQIATNIEIDVCRKATSRNEYILSLNQQIHGLIQADMARGSAAQQGYSDASSGPSPSSSSGRPPSANRFQTPGPDPSIPKSRIIAYMQTQAPHATRQTQAQTRTQDLAMNANGQQQGQVPEGSFVHSLLSNQSPMQAYEQNAGGSSQMQGGSFPMNGQYYNNQGRVTPNDQGGNQSAMDMQMQQQAFMQQRQARSQPSITTLQEFAAQVQHFDKSQMIELLWSQRNSLLQWQRRATQLEMQLNLQQQAAAATMGMNGAEGGYYNGPVSARQLQQPLGATVPPNVSSDAELQRENERRNARAWQEQQQYQSYSERGPEYGSAAASNPQTPAGPLSSMQIPGTNPSLYWKKVQALKSAYARELYFAHRALSQHNAPPNSAQSNKADNVKHNIGVAMSVLNEAPKTIQPRPFDVLDAIERFILNTVIPIVRKVQSGMAAHSQSMTSPGNPAGELSVQTIQDPSKRFMGEGMMMNNNIPPNYSRLPAMPSENKSQLSSPSLAMKMHNSSSTSLNSMTSTSPSAQYHSAESASVASTIKVGGGRNDVSRKPKLSVDRGSTSSVGSTPSLTTTTMNAIHDTSNGSNRASAVSEAKYTLKATDSKKANSSMEDNLNDFSDFPDLDFEDDLTDMATSKYNKENSSSHNPKKRSMADI